MLPIEYFSPQCKHFRYVPVQTVRSESHTLEDKQSKDKITRLIKFKHRASLFLIQFIVKAAAQITHTQRGCVILF